MAKLTFPHVYNPYFHPKLAISVSLRKEEVCQTNTPFSFKICSTKIRFDFMRTCSTSMLAMGWVCWHLTVRLNFRVSGWWINKYFRYLFSIHTCSQTLVTFNSCYIDANKCASTYLLMSIYLFSYSKLNKICHASCYLCCYSVLTRYLFIYLCYRCYNRE